LRPIFAMRAAITGATALPEPAVQAGVGAGMTFTPGSRCRPTYSMSTEMSGWALRSVSSRPALRSRRAIIAKSSMSDGSANASSASSTTTFAGAPSACDSA